MKLVIRKTDYFIKNIIVILIYSGAAPQLRDWGGTKYFSFKFKNEDQKKVFIAIKQFLPTNFEGRKRSLLQNLRKKRFASMNSGGKTSILGAYGPKCTPRDCSFFLGTILAWWGTFLVWEGTSCDLGSRPRSALSPHSVRREPTKALF